MRGKKVIVKCKNCRTEFEARVADRKRGWGRYCSRSCKAKKQSKVNGGYNNRPRENISDAERNEREHDAVMDLMTDEDFGYFPGCH